MKIVENFKRKSKALYDAPGVCLGFIGDSVTQGCFDVYMKLDGNVETFFDQENGYHAHLKRMLAYLYPNVPVSIINAGISGDNAPHGAQRVKRDIIDKSPDLAVVCFGLNDSGNGEEGIERYRNGIASILSQLQDAGIETILMTPNMMNTSLSPHLKDEPLKEIALRKMKVQNDGILDAYVECAKAVAAEYGVRVCDCYAKWKILHESGVDVTELLANKINHPTKEMNLLFAVSLLETMLS